MAQLSINLPDDLNLSIGLTPAEAAAQVRLMAALKLFELGKLSAGKAAELAGLAKVEFLEACARYRVSVYNYPPEELQGELRADLETLQRGAGR